jgi:seryl-tRNA synthetase
MFDLKDIRNRAAEYDANWGRRAIAPQTPMILDLDQKRRQVQTELQDLQNDRNVKSKDIGKIKSTGGDAQSLMDEVASIKDKMSGLEEQENLLSTELNALLSSIPNQLADDVPEGADEDENVEICRFMDTPNGNPDHPDHVTIGETLGMMDFETAAKLSGSRFVVLKGALARLDRALAQFMLDTHTNDHGYTEVQPPLLVSSDCMYGTTQLPKFEDDQFETTDGRWLLPTSEVALTNLVRESIIEDFDAPLRYTAYTPCFRKEAGSAGRDTRGMIRQHQFYKVEMVSITKPEDSEAEHERMVGCAETILKKLELPFRSIVLCAGDTGFAARKTYDLEVWVPSQQTYREISSCSNCGDIQARRMNARYRPDGSKGTEFVHTLNGSGLAVGRTLVAVLENYWDEASQSVTIPDVLKPYMGGIDRLEISK